MRVTRFMSEAEWEVFQDGKILINDTDHYKGGKGGSLSVGFCFTEDEPQVAWKYLSGVVDADVCVTFDFPDGFLTESTAKYADQSEDAKFADLMDKREWCCTSYSLADAHSVDVIDPYMGDEYQELKNIVESLAKIGITAEDILGI